MTHYEQLKEIFTAISHMQYLQNIISWDEEVLMPEGAGEYRGQAMATLELTIQRMLNDGKIPALLAQAQTETLSAWDQANLALMAKKHLMASCVPPELMANLAQMTQQTSQAWRQYRAENNWQAFVPHLEKLFQIKKNIAEIKAKVLGCDPYDALLDEYSPGFNQQIIDPIFNKIKTGFPLLRQQIIAAQAETPLVKPTVEFPIEKQNKLSLTAMKMMLIDMDHARLDVSAHPMTSGYPIDVRLTTRYNDDGIESLFGILHETGHGLYEQGMPKECIFQPVGQIQSMAMHEGQALLFENIICRSHAFWDHFSSVVQAEFGADPSLSAENLYRYVNRVKSTLIRVDSDEISYPLHVVLRYELEKRLFNSEITIADLPQHWNEAMRAYFNVSTEGNDKDGVMQDIHWSIGYFGYFPAYALGQAISAQLFQAFQSTHPEFDGELAAGDFSSIHHWLQENVYQYGSSLSTNDLLTKVTGEPLNSDHLLNYIQSKYLPASLTLQPQQSKQELAEAAKSSEIGLFAESSKRKAHDLCITNEGEFVAKRATNNATL